MISRSLFLLTCCYTLLLVSGPAQAATPSAAEDAGPARAGTRSGPSWPMILHDAGASSASPAEAPPPLRIRWVLRPPNAAELFRPAVAGGRVYLTYRADPGTRDVRALERAGVPSVRAASSFVHSYLMAVNEKSGLSRTVADLGLWDVGATILDPGQPIPDDRPHNGLLNVGVASGPLARSGLLLVVTVRREEAPASSSVVRLFPGMRYDGDLDAFDARTGKLAWSRPIGLFDEPYTQSPKAVGAWVIIGTHYYGPARCFDGKTGRDMGFTSMRDEGPIVAADNLMYLPTEQDVPGEVGSFSHGIYETVAYHLPDLKRVWTRHYVTPLVAAGGRLFCSVYPHGLCCLDEQGHLLWKRAHADLAGEYPQIAVAGGRLFVDVPVAPFEHSHHVRVGSAREPKRGQKAPDLVSRFVALDARTGRMLWRSRLDGVPVVAGSVLYLWNNAGLYALSARTGAALWHAQKIGRYDLRRSSINLDSGGTALDPIAADGLLLLPTQDWLLALEPVNGHRP